MRTPFSDFVRLLRGHEESHSVGKERSRPIHSNLASALLTSSRSGIAVPPEGFGPSEVTIELMWNSSSAVASTSRSKFPASIFFATASRTISAGPTRIAAHASSRRQMIRTSQVAVAWKHKHTQEVCENNQFHHGRPNHQFHTHARIDLRFRLPLSSGIITLGMSIRSSNRKSLCTPYTRYKTSIFHCSVRARDTTSVS